MELIDTVKEKLAESNDAQATKMVEKAKLLAYELSQNFPEHALCLQCTDLNYGTSYKDMSFTFYDEEEDKEYVVTGEMMVKGLILLWFGIMEKRFFFHAVNEDNMFEEDSYDLEPIDGMAQCAIFGDVIYG